MSGKNKHHGTEKEEKRNKGENPSGINIVIGENQPTQPKEMESEKRPEEIAEVSPVEKLKSQLEEKTREALEYLDKWIRLQAEFENYKKRIQKEKSDQMKFGNEMLLKALLPVLDNLERAIEHGKGAKEAAPLLSGVEITQRQFLNALEKFGVKPAPSVGEVFDPEKHEAVAQIDHELEANRVVSEVQKGYLFHERLLRPAKVIVSKAKSEGTEEEKGEA